MSAADASTRNGVDTAALFATLDVVTGDNEIPKVQFRVSKWIGGTHNQSAIHGFYGATQEVDLRRVGLTSWGQTARPMRMPPSPPPVAGKRARKA